MNGLLVSFEMKQKKIPAPPILNILNLPGVKAVLQIFEKPMNFKQIFDVLHNN